MTEITILPAQHCRRSRKILAYLEQRGIHYTRIELESATGQALADRYALRASPGILVDGEPINPLDLLIQPRCVVDEAVTDAVFGTPVTPSQGSLQ